MREINVGDYVRTKYCIKKIHEINKKATKWKYLYKCKKQDGDGCIDLCYLNEDNILKSSKNIIDLIEVGDFVKGLPVVHNSKAHGGNIVIVINGNAYNEEEIKNVVTKEQFESMAYEVK